MNKKQLIAELIEDGYLKTKNVINAFNEIPREDFIHEQYRKQAYVNEPLPTMAGQTISQPLTIAIMTEALDVRKGNKILEIGTGSGYQAALLSKIVGEKGKVITTEIIPELFEFASKNLKKYANVTVVQGDGSLGHENEHYDRIIVTADAGEVPAPLVKQLTDGGKMVIPVRGEMLLLAKNKSRMTRTFLGYFAFVPLRGRYGR
jgi:protein-L-isoaspartate(D-aspartate) O-methyltransferase